MIQKIIDSFFDFEQPCPKEIPLCEDVRRAYQQELDKASKSGCSSCAKVNIKSRFLEAIWKEAISSITSKVSS